MPDTGHVSVAQRPTTPDELLRPVTPDRPVLLAGSEALWTDSGILDWLETAGWSAAVAADPERAAWLASIQKQSLVVVAGTDPEVWSMVEAIRPATMAPLVVLGAPPPDSVITLLGHGVDAVVDPAHGLDDVFARIVALLRRSDHGWGPGTRYLRAGGLRVDLWSQECFLDDEPLRLSPTEYALLTFLMTHPQQALSSATIVRRVWGWFNADGKNALRIFVNRLRRKLHDDPRAPAYIASVRGTGYRFIRNVTELGDEAEAPASQTDVAALLQSVEDLAISLLGCADVVTAAERFLAALDATGYADGMAVFRLDTKKMHLVASRHMAPEWTASVEGGIPLKPTYASAQSVLIREPVQFGDIREMAKHFSSTAAQLEGAGYRACLFLPVLCGDAVWGHVGLVRRSSQPFDPTGTSYVRAACAVFALGVDDIHRTCTNP
jgi:two-component system, OmpR family, KDP operon response regulator KdpE